MLLKELLNIVDGYLVGGCVRDNLLGRIPKDYDIVTLMTPSEIRERVEIAYALGEKFGTVAVATSDHGVVEVTTARSDITGGRHPEVRWTSDIMKDLKRRDFTMNALIMGNDGIIGGVADGLQDIEDGVIRCVGSAADRLNEDTLRALRAIRFKIELDFQFDNDLENVLPSFDLKLGTALAGTRVMDELQKMFSINAARSVHLLDEYNLLEQIFPEVDELHKCLENPKWHPAERTTFIHTLNVMKRAQKHPFKIQVAALLHDIGKNAVRHGDSMKYYGHDMAGKKLITPIAQRLLWSNDLKELCEFVCENHMKMHHIEEMRAFKRRALYTNKNFGALYSVHAADAGDRVIDGHYQWIINDAIKLLDAEPLITGDDIVALGFSGPRVGILKARCHEAQLAGIFNTREEGIEYLRDLII